MDTTLLDYLRSLPGGVRALAQRSGVARTTIYSFACGAHRRVPWRIIHELHEHLPLERDELLARWRTTQEAQGCETTGAD